MKYAHQTWRFLLHFLARIRQDRVMEWAAQFSFYLMLALFPFLALLTSLASQTRLMEDNFLEQLSGVLPPQAYEVVINAVNDITASQKPGVLTLSVFVALWAASNGVFQLSKGLNMAHKVKEKRKTWAVRGLSLLFIFMIIGLIFMQILLILFGNFILSKLALLFPTATLFLTIGRVIRVLAPIMMVFLTLSLMYFFIPSHRVPFRSVMPGALFTTVVWMASSWLFSIYVARFADYSRFYGSLGGVIVLMIWIFISSITLLMGSEVNDLLEGARKRKDVKKMEGERPHE